MRIPVVVTVAPRLHFAQPQWLIGVRVQLISYSADTADSLDF